MRTIEDYSELLQSTIIRHGLETEEDNKQLIELLTCISEFRPKNFFRYRMCNESSFDALLRDRIYFNQPKNFNDPHDCFCYVNVDEILSSMAKSVNIERMKTDMKNIRDSTNLLKESFSPNILPVIEETYNNIKSLTDSEFDIKLKTIDEKAVEITKYIGGFEYIVKQNIENQNILSREQTHIACLSATITSTLMWAHYADYHKGFALEYDTDEIIRQSWRCQQCDQQCSEKYNINLYPIVYGDKRYDATDFIIERINQTISHSYGYNNPIIFPDSLYVIKANTYKSLDWKYEQEWRMIYSCKSNKPNAKFEVLKPTAIYLGSQVSESNKRIILKLIEGKDLTVYEMYVDDNNEEYALSYKML